MMRGLLLMLMLGYAAVPPGICFCRLSQLVLADVDNAPPAQDDDDHDDCGCPRIQHDAVLRTAQAAAAPTSAMIAVRDADRLSDPQTVFSSFGQVPRPDSRGAPPLYLLLRTLQI